MGDSGAAEEQLPTISDDLVVTKYKMAAEIVNGKPTASTCSFGAPATQQCRCWVDTYQRVKGPKPLSFGYTLAPSFVRSRPDIICTAKNVFIHWKEIVE